LWERWAPFWPSIGFSFSPVRRLRHLSDFRPAAATEVCVPESTSWLVKRETSDAH
jgi:hypothetical protein